MDPLGDHALACSRTGLLARRAKVVEPAWVRVAREAVGAEGQVVHSSGSPTQPLPASQPRTVGASTLSSTAPLPTAGRCAATQHWCPPEDRAPASMHSGSGLGCAKGRTSFATSSASGWARRWWGALSVAIQLAVASTALRRAWPAAPAPAPGDGPCVLDLAADEAPSRLPATKATKAPTHGVARSLGLV